MSGPRGWARDLALGVRLVVGGGRNAWARLALTAVGVGLGVGVLLLAAALPAVDTARMAREAAATPVVEPTADDTEAHLMLASPWMSFRGKQVHTYLVEVTGPDPAVPPGVDRLPARGEMVVSPALAELLASPDGALLRPRIPWTQVGTVEWPGLGYPDQLLLYAGEPVDPGRAETVYGFGVDDVPEAPIGLVLLAIVGAVVVLVPVLVLIAATTRVAAAARERRLAAFRLLGADAGQVRRLASGEALVGALGGVVIGLVFYLAGRQLTARLSPFGMSMYPDDLAPSPTLIALALLVVPGLAVLTAVVSLRHVVAHPLGLQRGSTPPRRRLWWRLVPLAVGVGLLASQAGEFTGDPGDLTIVLVVTGLGLTGLAVPVLLPWLVQRAVDPLSGGAPSWQLAIRRIQLDSGTPARAAGGLAAVLTAAIAFQTIIASAFADNVEWERQRVGALEGRMVEVYSADPAVHEERLAALADLDGVLDVRTFREVAAFTDGGGFAPVKVAPCAVLATFARLDGCADGDVFVVTGGEGVPLTGGETVRFDKSGGGGGGSDRSIAPWTLPADVRPAQPNTDRVLGLPPGSVLATPAAVPVDRLAEFPVHAAVLVDPDDRDMAELVSNALVPLGRRVTTFTYDSDSGLVQLRNALLAGALVVLLLAAASLLIVSVEQVRERRRQLAALAASGVSGRTLGASVLWQAAVPFGVATIASLGVGTGLGLLLMRVFDRPATFDWSGMVIFVAASAAAVLAVTALTLPSLRRATRPDGLRME